MPLENIALSWNKQPFAARRVMVMQRRLGRSVLLAVWLLASATWVYAVTATDGVKGLMDKAMEIQHRPDLQGAEQRSQRAQLVRQLIAESFLTTDMARESLKEQWEKLPPAKRQEFTTLFTDLFQDSYTRMVLNYLKQQTVEYRGEQVMPAGAQVQTSIIRANEHIPVDYALAQKDGRWLVRDVTIDGVSIVGNYQSQFRRVIQAQSFDELLKKLRLQSQAIRDNPS
jgi:phospholipid transport system substrate-binding protein